MARIRPKAVCAIRRGAELLAIPGHDPATGARFWLLPGGGIEFGERAEDAARREVREELNVEIAGAAVLGVLQNLFTYAGVPGHEIVFVVGARLADEALYAKDEIAWTEADGMRFAARWVPLREIGGAGASLMPAGALELIYAADPAR